MFCNDCASKRYNIRAQCSASKWYKLFDVKVHWIFSDIFCAYSMQAALVCVNELSLIYTGWFYNQKPTFTYARRFQVNLIMVISFQTYLTETLFGLIYCDIFNIGPSYTPDVTVICTSYWIFIFYILLNSFDLHSKGNFLEIPIDRGRWVYSEQNAGYRYLKITIFPVCLWYCRHIRNDDVREKFGNIKKIL